MVRNRLIAKNATLNTEDQAMKWMECIYDLRIGRYCERPEDYDALANPDQEITSEGTTPQGVFPHRRCG